MMVCDRIFECPGWEGNFNLIENHLPADLARTPFVFCPWCGKWLNWDEWERLGGKWIGDNVRNQKPKPKEV